MLVDARQGNLRGCRALRLDAVSRATRRGRFAATVAASEHHLGGDAVVIVKFDRGESSIGTTPYKATLKAKRSAVEANKVLTPFLGGADSQTRRLLVSGLFQLEVRLPSVPVLASWL